MVEFLLRLFALNFMGLMMAIIIGTFVRPEICVLFYIMFMSLFSHKIIHGSDIQPPIPPDPL